MKQTEFENKNFKPKANVKPEPEYQGEPFRIDSRTVVRMPANSKLTRKEWERAMIEKYSDYDKKNVKAKLNGNAIKRTKSQL